MPGTVVQAAQRALDDTGVRDGIRCRASGVDPAGQCGRQLGDHLAERENEIRRQVRPGRVTARTAELDLDLVAGGGDRADPGPDLADLEPGIAVQSEDPVDRRDAAGCQHVKRPARHLLRWLEDQSHLAGQCSGCGSPRKEQAGSEQDRGVHVVTAGMAGTGIQRPVRNILLINDRQGVDVGSKRDCSGAFRQDSGPQSGGLKPDRDPAGRAVLGVTDLRMGMQVPAELDQLRLVARKKRL